MQTELISRGERDGVYYVLDRNNLAAGPLWQYQVESQAAFSVGLSVFSQNCNNTVSTSSWAGNGSPIMVAGVSLNASGKGCIGTMTTLDPATGHLLWQTPPSREGWRSGHPNTRFGGCRGRDFEVLSSATGKTLFSYTEPPLKRKNSGIFGAPTYWFWAPPTVSGNTVIVANQDGRSAAFTPSSK